jgi:hypothetical protein
LWLFSRFGRRVSFFGRKCGSRLYSSIGMWCVTANAPPSGHPCRGDPPRCPSPRKQAAVSPRSLQPAAVPLLQHRLGLPSRLGMRLKGAGTGMPCWQDAGSPAGQVHESAQARLSDVLIYGSVVDVGSLNERGLLSLHCHLQVIRTVSPGRELRRRTVLAPSVLIVREGQLPPALGPPQGAASERPAWNCSAHT